MEHLTKQQIILLTLLVSFVTSLSTGIVTVSLMDQAPAGVTRTINNVIEKTIQSAPQSAAVGVVSINVDDQIAKATALVASSTVKIKAVGSEDIVGLGLITSKEGSIIADKQSVDPYKTYTATLADGTIVPLSNSLSAQSNDSIAFFVPNVIYANGAPIVFSPIHTGASHTLGQKIFSLTGTSSNVLRDGFISSIGSTTVGTNISPSANTPGSPLFDSQGNVIGIKMLDSNMSGSFYLIAPVVGTN